MQRVEAQLRAKPCGSWAWSRRGRDRQARCGVSVCRSSGCGLRSPVRLLGENVLLMIRAGPSSRQRASRPARLGRGVRVLRSACAALIRWCRWWPAGGAVPVSCSVTALRGGVAKFGLVGGYLEDKGRDFTAEVRAQLLQFALSAAYSGPF